MKFKMGFIKIPKGRLLNSASLITSLLLLSLPLAYPAPRPGTLEDLESQVIPGKEDNNLDLSSTKTDAENSTKPVPVKFIFPNKTEVSGFLGDYNASEANYTVRAFSNFSENLNHAICITLPLLPSGRGPQNDGRWPPEESLRLRLDLDYGFRPRVKIHPRAAKERDQR